MGSCFALQRLCFSVYGISCLTWWFVELALWTLVFSETLKIQHCVSAFVFLRSDSSSAWGLQTRPLALGDMMRAEFWELRSLLFPPAAPPFPFLFLLPTPSFFLLSFLFPPLFLLLWSSSFLSSSPSFPFHLLQVTKFHSCFEWNNVFPLFKFCCKISKNKLLMVWGYLEKLCVNLPSVICLLFCISVFPLSYTSNV